ncbi:hypothetical protein P691DRAFT_669802 [Macrolepiota fuliginosa MF-IS2]|uniref:TM7S3/TM198-like domain-containing protein n=1 Tax=Macrolepiota fuliginosa MF-IS2 TaxID=1400762 RepID=A0A9P5XBE3_9AGAR|nr:hypothetical protein P691DRAFT_669802 [Macrolepiota fuliginosa MF-IS2]
MVSTVLAIPLSDTPSSTNSPHLQSRDRYILKNDTFTGKLRAFNPTTLQPVAQGPATDGSGEGLGAPVIIWMVFTLLVGVPLSLVGFRGWRISTGVGIGLVIAVASWASLINTMSATGIPDIFLTIIVLGFFLVGFILGCFEFGRIAGIVALGAMGGMSFGVRVMLLRSGLLIPVGDDGSGTGYALTWVLIAVFGVLGGLWIAWAQYRRSGILFGCAANGTFLTALGVDLILHKQAGMGSGLIFLFDRNSSHIVDVMTKGYKPTMATQIIVGVSLGVIPVLAFAQHRIFKAPFDRRKLNDQDADAALNAPIDDEPPPSPRGKSGGLLMRHRLHGSAISGLWDGILFKTSPNRFSV